MSENIKENRNESPQENQPPKKMKDLFLDLARLSGWWKFENSVEVDDVIKTFNYGNIELEKYEEWTTTSVKENIDKRIWNKEQKMSVNMIKTQLSSFTKHDINSLYLWITELIQKHWIKSEMFEYKDTNHLLPYAHLWYIFVWLCINMWFLPQDTKLENSNNPTPQDVKKVLEIYEKEWWRDIKNAYNKRISDNYQYIYVDIAEKGKKGMVENQHYSDSFDLIIKKDIYLGDLDNEWNIKYLDGDVSKKIEPKRWEIESITISWSSNINLREKYKGKLSWIKKIVIMWDNITSKIDIPNNIKEVILEWGYEELPSFSNCERLEKLKMENIKIKGEPMWELPKSLFDIKDKNTLKMINVQDNMLPATEINKLSMFQWLEILNIQNNWFDVFPTEIYNLINLRTLYIWITEINWELPEWIDKLSDLESLVIIDCRITKLPDSLCKLSSLKNIELTSLTDLKMLPEDIGNLQSLETFRVQWSGFTKLPNSFKKLKWLKYILLETPLENFDNVPLHLEGQYLKDQLKK